jgi:S1-C subfamily serine protease
VNVVFDFIAALVTATLAGLGVGGGGLLVLWLEDGGPAQKAGLLVGDILVGVAGKPVADPDDLFAALSGETVGKPVAVEVLRGGKPETINVTVAERK